MLKRPQNTDGTFQSPQNDDDERCNEDDDENETADPEQRLNVAPAGSRPMPADQSANTPEATQNVGADGLLAAHRSADQLLAEMAGRSTPAQAAEQVGVGLRPPQDDDVKSTGSPEQKSDIIFDARLRDRRFTMVDPNAAGPSRPQPSEADAAGTSRSQ